MPEQAVLAAPWEVWLVALLGGFAGAAVFYCYVSTITDPRLLRWIRRVWPWARDDL